MAIYYSPTTGGFYDTDFADYALPDDAVEITCEDHQALLAAQTAGSVIQPGGDGRPVAVEPQVDHAAVLVSQAQALLDANDKTALRLWKSGGSWPPAWQAYDEALREVVRGNATVLPAEPTMKPWEA